MARGVQTRALIKLGRWTEAATLVEAALARGPVGITRRMIQLLRCELQLGHGEIKMASDTLAQARRAAEGDHPFAGKLFELNAWLTAAQGDFAAAHLSVTRGLAALDGLDDHEAARGCAGAACRSRPTAPSTAALTGAARR